MAIASKDGVGQIPDGSCDVSCGIIKRQRRGFRTGVGVRGDVVRVGLGLDVLLGNLPFRKKL